MKKDMSGPTAEWLEYINGEFRRKDIPHKQRPWIAWMEWSNYSGASSSLSNEERRFILL
jgi:hypothetical protein